MDCSGTVSAKGVAPDTQTNKQSLAVGPYFEIWSVRTQCNKNDRCVGNLFGDFFGDLFGRMWRCSLRRVCGIGQ